MPRRPRRPRGSTCHVGAAERGVRAAVGEHRALAVRRDQHDDAAGRQHRVDGEPAVDPGGGQLGRGGPAGLVGADPGDQRDVDVVRASQAAVLPPAPPGATRDPAAGVVTEHDRARPAGHHVEPDIADHRDCGRAAGHARRVIATRPGATATSAPPATAFASTSSTFTRRLAPWVRSWKYSSSRGVTSLPVDPLRREQRQARRQRRGRADPGPAAGPAGSGFASTTPAGRWPARRRRRSTAAACRRACPPARAPDTRSRTGRSRGTRRCGSRAPARTGSPGTPGCRARPGSTSPRRTPPPPACGRARRGRRRRRRCRRRRGARRRARRWRRPRCRPGGRGRRWTRPWSRRRRPERAPTPTSRTDSLAISVAAHSRSSSAAVGRPGPRRPAPRWSPAPRRRPGRRLDPVGDPPVVARGQPVGQDRRFQRDHGAAGVASASATVGGDPRCGRSRWHHVTVAPSSRTRAPGRSAQAGIMTGGMPDRRPGADRTASTRP